MSYPIYYNENLMPVAFDKFVQWYIAFLVSPNDAPEYKSQCIKVVPLSVITTSRKKKMFVKCIWLHIEGDT